MPILPDALTTPYRRSETGTVTRNVRAKFDEQSLCVFDFMTKAQIASVRANDQVADVTVPIQNALNWFSNPVFTTPTATGPRFGQLYFPAGIYKITSTLYYEGASGYSFQMMGEQGKTHGNYGGVFLKWAGASGGTLFHTYGWGGSFLEKVNFSGGGLAKYLLRLDSLSFPEPGDPAGVGCSDIVVRDCSFSDWLTNVDSVAVLLGHAPGATEQTEQVDNLRFYNCLFGGNAAPGNGAGVCKFKGGNVKDHHFLGCVFESSDYAIDFTDCSSTVVIDHCTLAGIRVCNFNFRGGIAGNLRISDVECENYAGSRFIDCHGGSGSNSGCTTLINNSYQSSADTDDVVMVLSGAVIMIGNLLYNTRASDSMPRIHIVSPGMDAAEPGAIISLGNGFENAVRSAPFWDTSGNQLFDDYGSSYYGQNNLEVSITSLGDYSFNSAGVTKLQNRLPASTFSGGLTIGSPDYYFGNIPAKIKRHMRGTANWDPGSINTGASATTTVTVALAAVGDEVTVGFSNSLAGLMLTGYVSTSGTVTVVLGNLTGSSVDLASGTVSASVWQH